MLEISGKASRFCDGRTRRNFLQAGFLGLGGLSLAEVLSARAASPTSARSASQTSVIFVELAGGPTQFETYDPKPQAPLEYRGPFTAIRTREPGFWFSEHMAAQARIVDKLTIVRSIHHTHNSHDPSSHLTQTGYYKTGPKGGPNQMPCIGSVIARFRGPNHPSLPGYVAVPQIMRNGQAAQLGRAYNPFETISDPNSGSFQVRNLGLASGLSLARLDDRRALLTSLDSHRRLTDLAGSAVAVDQFSRQAFDLVTASQAREAFDISREDSRIRDRYGRNTVGQSLLLARRLVEAGVTCVTVRATGWDDHNKLADGLRQRGPQFDQGIAALISDLAQRGLSHEVLVVAMGEFGRTPRVNQNAGRDHWGALMSVLLAGGGLRPGILGSSNSKGEEPTSHAYRPENVLATVYRHLGIDPKQTFADFSGRPRYLLEERDVIQEII